jgi:hypothetical protein
MVRVFIRSAREFWVSSGFAPALALTLMCGTRIRMSRTIASNSSVSSGATFTVPWATMSSRPTRCSGANRARSAGQRTDNSSAASRKEKLLPGASVPDRIALSVSATNWSTADNTASECSSPT